MQVKLVEIKLNSVLGVQTHGNNILRLKNDRMRFFFA